MTLPIELPPVVAGPLYVVVGIDFSASVAGEVALSTEFTLTKPIRAVCRVDQEGATLKDFSFASQNTALEKSFSANVDGSISFRVAAQPRVKVKILGTPPSLTLGVEGYAELKYAASTRNPPSLTLSSGVDLAARFCLADVQIFGKKWEIELWNGSYSLLRLSYPITGAVPDFSCSPKWIDRPPLQVTFTDESNAGDANLLWLSGAMPVIRAYHWDFGDNSFSDLQNPSHVYTQKGTYRAMLWVDSNLFSSPMIHEEVITIGKDRPPPPDKEDDRDNRTPVKSCDPNAMAGPLGFGDADTQRYVVPGQWMDYIVYFENVSNATAAAQEVYVDANLSSYLDWSTLELGEVSFNNQTEMGLAGKRGGTFTVDQQGTSYQVRVSFSLDQAAGAASWYLRSYDPTTADGWPADPYAGFLPPNDAAHRGEGHLAYRVKVRDDAPVDTRVTAAASIVFDQNAAIMTDPSWWNTIVPPEVPVAFHGNGGTPDLTVSNYVFNAQFGGFPGVAREEYVFGGWTNRLGAAVTTGTAVSFAVTNLYAKWMAPETFHPADTDQNMTVETLELLEYIDGWQRNVQGIETLYLLDAIEIWQSNKPYAYDDAEQPPACWKVQ